MNLRLAAVTLRLHRFEVLVAVIAVVLTGIWALVIVIRVDGLGVPADCLAWFPADWTEAPAECERLLRQYIANLYEDGPLAVLDAQSLFSTDRYLPEGAPVWSIMMILPFAAGVLVGVPIVGRELEAGTAQTAWSLDASRARWLIRRILPIALVVGAASAFTAVAATMVAERELVTTISPALPILGLHGLPVLARLLAAFGLGLLAGCVVPRSLPALVVGVLLCVVVSVGVAKSQEIWLDAQPSLPRVEGEARIWAFTGEWRYQTPDGRLLTPAEVGALVPDEIEALDVGLVQPLNTSEWLGERGIELVPLGIPEVEAVTGWFPFDVLLHTGAGIVGIAGAFLVVDRRRPTT